MLTEKAIQHITNDLSQDMPEINKLQNVTWALFLPLIGQLHHHYPFADLALPLLQP